MIEAFALQRDQREFGAAMFRVAACAISLAGGTFIVARMIPGIRFHFALDLGMTFEAFQTALPKIVASCALRNAPEVRVGARQRTRRNLRARGDARAEQCQSRTPERKLDAMWPYKRSSPPLLPISFQKHFAKS